MLQVGKRGGEPDVQTNLIEGSDSRFGRTQNGVETKARVWELEGGGRNHSGVSSESIASKCSRCRLEELERKRVCDILLERGRRIEIVSESRTKTRE